MRAETDLRIVGIDPGTTSGVALLDLGGELVDYTSRKEFSKDRIIQFMVENGKPLVLATDVSPAPSLVEEIAANTGSRLVAPEEDLDSGYKEDLVSDFGVEEKDSHVKDALAAAEYSRREYADKLEEIERRVEAEGVEEKLQDVVELVVKGSLSISEAVSEVKKVSGPEEEGEGEPREEERDWEAIADRRKQRIDILESKVENLEEHVEEGEDQESDGRVSDELRRRNSLIQDLRTDLEREKAKTERLESRQERLEKALGRMEEGWIRVSKVRSLEDPGDETVFMERYDGGPISERVETVVTREPSGELKEAGVEVLDVEEVDRMVELEDSLVIHPEEFERAEDPERFMEWLESYRGR